MLNSSTQNILDVAGQVRMVGDEGVSKASWMPGTLGRELADSQFQGTTIEALVDAVFRAEEHAEQSRLEEIEAEREGVDTAASGYPEPMYERNGR